MLNFDIQHEGKTLSMELPAPIEVLAGELRSIGIYEPMSKIPQSDFTLRPMNELGEHFMKLIKPENNLQRIAWYCLMPPSLTSKPRETIEALIRADRFRDFDHMADYLEYGPDALDGLIRMTRDGRSIVLPTSQINMYQCFGTETPMGLVRLAEMELAPVSEPGKQLMAEFQPYSDTVAIANLACDLVRHPAFAQADLSKFMEGIRIFQMPMDTETMSFYCPLFVRQYDPDTEEYEAIEHVYLTRNEDEIRATLQAWTNGKDETEFLDDGLRPKIASLGWEIERFGGEVYGKAVCEIRAPLTESEQAELAQWLSENASDGLLENFGEYPIKTGDGDLYVSFWDYSSDGYMLPEDEFRAQVLGEQAQGFGGTEGMAAPPVPTDTLIFYCPMIVQCYDGEDEDPIELGNNYLVLHEEEVRAAVLDMVDCNAVTDHLPDVLQGKITSIRWDVAKIGGEVYGKIMAEIHTPLTAAEQEKLADWIYNQNEGAHGDGFEQLLVDTGDGELCVSFWNSSPDCYVLPEEDFRAQVLGEQEQATVAQATGIQHISLGELCGMTNREGLILQGCGGNAKASWEKCAPGTFLTHPQEWLDGINEMFAEEGILRGGDQFRTASVFEHDGCINILFPMDDVDLDVGKLAMWRLHSRGTFGGTWLSDYLPNRLGIGVDEDLSAMDCAEEIDEAQGFGGMEGMA